MKHIYTWVNAVSVDKSNIKTMLKNNQSPVFCPGGVQEVVYLSSLSKDKELILYLNKRFGFIKIALQLGKPIVPVFSFGLNNSFSSYIPTNKFIILVGRRVGVLPMMFFGLWNTPLGPAKPCSYTNIVGKPIPIPLILEPKDEDLKKYHTIYINELTRLYELFKMDYGLENVKLKIV